MIDTAILDDQQQQTFQREGWLRLGHIVDDDLLAALRQRIDDIMLGRVPFAGMMQRDSEGGGYGELEAQTAGHKGATLAYRKIEGLEHDAVFARYLHGPVVTGIARQLVGEEVAIYRAMFMNKPAGRGTELPWHQDGGRIWNLTGDPLINIWLALDPATIANGCVQIVPGSHELGLLSERGHTITPEQEAELCRPEDVVHLEVEAGEAVLLHNWVLHRSGVNTSGIPRRAFAACLMDAGIRHREDLSRSYYRLV